MLVNIRFIIFDLNGTLVVGEYPDWHRVLEDCLGFKRRGSEYLSLDVFRSVARGRQSLLEGFTKAYDFDWDEGLEARAIDAYVSGIRLRKNAVHILERLERRYRLILCSDTTGPAKVVVKRLRLKKFFSRMFFSCDMGFLKSERGFWDRALSNLQYSTPKELLMVGDNPFSDVYWPKKIGMHTVLIESDISSPQDYVAKPEGSIYEEPDLYIIDLEELLKLLQIGSI